MKINLAEIDRENFMVHPHDFHGETVYLVQPIHIGAKWNKQNLIFRSSVWNAEGELVSASFKKFFNWSEQPELCYTPFSLTANGGCQLIEKIDGSTLIVSKYKGNLMIRTRGTTDATKLDNGHEIEILRQKYSYVFDKINLLIDTSYIFEWVSPTNKIVINYGNEPELYLTAIIDHDGYDMVSQDVLDINAAAMGVKRPKTFNFNSIKEMLDGVEQLKGQEGLCVYCNWGQDIRKVKSAWYLACHHMRSELGSYERVIDLFFTIGQPNYTDFYKYVVNTFDFEIANLIKNDISIICDGMKEVKLIIAHLNEFIAPLRQKTRKDAALAIIQAYGQTNRAGMAFKLLDGKELLADDLKKLLYQVTKD